MSVFDNSFDDLILHDSDDYNFMLGGDRKMNQVLSNSTKICGNTDRSITQLTANEITEEINVKSCCSNKRKSLPAHEADVRSLRPRLVKTDFRRQFAKMWTDVFNSCDHDYMMNHILMFYEKDVSLKLRDMRQWKSDYTPESEVTAQGISFLAHFWFKNMNSAPDLVCRMKHSAVTVRSDNTSIVRCCFTLTGTKILHLKDSPDADTVDSFLRYKYSVPQDNAEISPTAAALAAVAPRKVAALHRAERIDRLAAMTTAVPTVMVAPVNVYEKLQTAEAVFSHCPEEDAAAVLDPVSVHVEAVSFRDELDSSLNSNNDDCNRTRDRCGVGAGAAKDDVGETLVPEVETNEDDIYMVHATPAPPHMQEPLQDHQMQQFFLFQQFHQQQNQQPRGPSMEHEQLALTAALDCVCSFEMHFNAQQKVHMMVVNYIT